MFKKPMNLFLLFMILIMGFLIPFMISTRPEPPLVLDEDKIVLPIPEPAIEPSFAFLAAPPVKGGKIQWSAVYTLAVLSDIAYSDAEDQILRAKAIGAEVVHPLSVGSSEGFVASDEKCVVIAFRGTQGVRDLVTDVLGFPVFMNGGVVHHGFSRAIGSIYQAAISAAEDQGALDQNKGKTVWVTGHSLGGAIACGFSMVSSKEKRLKIDGIVTYGQPLVMNTSLCQFMLYEYGDRYLRVVNGVDPITRLVKAYRHSGARAQIHDGGEYDWQPPRIATMAPAPGVERPSERPEVQAIETNPELELISVEEAMELDKKIKELTNDSPVVGSSTPRAVGAFHNPFAEHFIAGYINRLREIAMRKKVKPTVSD